MTIVHLFSATLLTVLNSIVSLQSNKVPVVQPSHAVHPLTPLITYSDEHFAPGSHSGLHPQDANNKQGRRSRRVAQRATCPSCWFESCSCRSRAIYRSMQLFLSIVSLYLSAVMWPPKGFYQKTCLSHCSKVFRV